MFGIRYDGIGPRLEDINALYREILGRDADEQGLAAFDSGNADLKHISNSLLTSEEFSKSKSNFDLVSKLKAIYDYENKKSAFDQYLRDSQQTDEGGQPIYSGPAVEDPGEFSTPYDKSALLRAAIARGEDLSSIFGGTYADSLRVLDDLNLGIRTFGKDNTIIVPASPTGYQGAWRFDPVFGSAYYKDAALEIANQFGVDEEVVRREAGKIALERLYTNDRQNRMMLGVGLHSDNLLPLLTERILDSANVTEQEIRDAYLNNSREFVNKVSQGLYSESNSSGFFKQVIGDITGGLGPVGDIIAAGVSFVPGFQWVYPAYQGAKAYANDGSLGDILKTTGKAYVASAIGAKVGASLQGIGASVGGTLANASNGAISAEVAGRLVTNAAANATKNVLLGANFKDAVLTSVLSAGAAEAANFFNDSFAPQIRAQLQAETDFDEKTIDGITKGVVKVATNAILSEAQDVLKGVLPFSEASPNAQAVARTAQRSGGSDAITTLLQGNEIVTQDDGLTKQAILDSINSAYQLYGGRKDINGSLEALSKLNAQIEQQLNFANQASTRLQGRADRSNFDPNSVQIDYDSIGRAGNKSFGQTTGYSDALGNAIRMMQDSSATAMDRSFAREQLGELQGIAAEYAAIDAADKAAARNASDQLTAALMRQYTSMGAPELLSQAGIDARANELYNAGQLGLDRAMRIASSQSYANDIRNQMDASTLGLYNTDEMVRKFAPLYAEMAANSYNQALAQEVSRVQNTNQSRASALQEIGTVYQPAVENAFKLYRPRDAEMAASQLGLQYAAQERGMDIQALNSTINAMNVLSNSDSQAAKIAIDKTMDTAKIKLAELNYRGDLDSKYLNYLASSSNQPLTELIALYGSQSAALAAAQNQFGGQLSNVLRSGGSADKIFGQVVSLGKKLGLENAFEWAKDVFDETFMTDDYLLGPATDPSDDFLLGSATDPADYSFSEGVFSGMDGDLGYNVFDFDF